MKKILVIIICVLSFTSLAQDTIQVQNANIQVNEAEFGTKKRTKNMNTVYHRSSLHNILLFHNGQKYSKEILDTYNKRPQSEKFNDHSLPFDIINVKGPKYVKDKKVKKYINEADLADDLVAKWFNRNETTGYCNMDLIFKRGLEGARTEDIEMSEYAKRGQALLTDFGTELIGNTYVLVHDIVYIDKAERNEKTSEGIKIFGWILELLGNAAAQATGDDSYNDIGKGINEISRVAADVVDEFGGFRVKIKTHLYRLNWQASDNDYFYENYYLDENYYDQTKYDAWKNAKYSMSYLGSQEVISAQTVLKNNWDLSELIKIVLYRALDESVVKLQRNYEEFKIKEPIYEIDEKGNVLAKIGLKEGVSEDSKYEVLERVEEADGTFKYKKVGTIKPIKKKIWDNRYKALEDGQPNADLGYTTFKVTNGHDFYPGLLIREVKF